MKELSGKLWLTGRFGMRSVVLLFSDDLRTDLDKLLLWNAFLRKTKIKNGPLLLVPENL